MKGPQEDLDKIEELRIEWKRQDEATPEEYKKFLATLLSITQSLKAWLRQA